MEKYNNLRFMVRLWVVTGFVFGRYKDLIEAHRRSIKGA